MDAEIVNDLHALAPELWLVATIVVTVVADLVFGASRRALLGTLALAGVGMALWTLLGVDSGADARTFGMLSLDGYAGFFRTLIIAGTGVIILHGLVFRGMEESSRNEFVPMLLGTALGGCLLVSTDNLVMLLLSMELLSLNSYLLAAWQRKERRSSEAALKYLVYGAMASALMVFGFSLFYGLSGSLSMPEVGRAIAATWADPTAGYASQLAVVVASLLVLAGFGFKIAAFPFHFWAPDVYEGSPTPVTTFLAVSSKAAGFGVLVRFVDSVYLCETANADWVARIGWILAVLSAITMTFGNVVAVLQRNVKRLLAYSSIAHAGYLLMGLAVMTSGTPDGARQGMDAVMFYMATYYLATLGAFGCVMALANRFGAEDLSDYEGLAWSAPWTSSLLVVFLISLTGLPPTVGFVGKFWLFDASLKAGLYWLAIVAALNAVVALFYYLKLARALFLRGETTHVEGLKGRGVMPWLAQATLVLLAFAAVWYCFAFDGLAEWVERSLL
ncbi:MAG: NADH-quinone oxidoreductase subunit N [Planctomycetes bacterium]|nr:NADH-quinone oxidoreductase subunit N [Planctomycetota bacterium]